MEDSFLKFLAKLLRKLCVELAIFSAFFLFLFQSVIRDFFNN
jgi:hypothetical protein